MENRKKCTTQERPRNLKRHPMLHPPLRFFRRSSTLRQRIDLPAAAEREFQVTASLRWKSWRTLQ